MGSGKSTVGPLLANTLGYNFIDLDERIEEQEQKTIKKIFETHGEEYFRKTEYNVLQKISQQTELVVALGGGTILHQKNLSLIKEKGILIYLKTDIEILYKRLQKKNSRPLLQNDNGKSFPNEQLKKKIQTLLIERSPYYEQADIIIQTEEKNVGETIQEIEKKIEIL